MTESEYRMELRRLQYLRVFNTRAQRKQADIDLKKLKQKYPEYNI